MSDEIAPDKDPLFSFDGAEGIAFWVYDPATSESARVMIAEVPRLRAFLDHWFPEHDERWDEQAEVTWSRIIFNHQLDRLGPPEKGWVKYSGASREAVRDGAGRVFFDLLTRPSKQASRAVADTFQADRA